MRAFVALVVLLAAGTLRAEPLAREDVPEPLRPWVDWVLRDHERETCPFLAEVGDRPCVWPGRLALRLDASGGELALDVYVAAAASVALPGAEDGPWPEDVRVDGAPAATFGEAGEPRVRLARGAHRVEGRFAWTAPPPGLRVPESIALIDLTLNGQRVAQPRRDDGGTLWLRDPGARAPAAAAENRVDVDVYRRLSDGVPVRLDTHVTLRISGEAREEVLGVALPEGALPIALSASLPARLDPDGRLRVQLRPGRWEIDLAARVAQRKDAFSPPAQPPGARWDRSEVWSVALAPSLRLVDVEGPPSVDPTQTEMPPEWRQLPAYRMEPGAAIRLAERRRGSEGAAADQLTLDRTWHLDFDGGGATVVDRIAGTLRSSLRLEMGERTALGRVAIAGQDQPITKRKGGARLGVETTLGALALEADSRVEGGVRRLPAVGWDHDFEAVSGSLMIPPGYRLLHASGVDDASPTWIADWDLLSIFFVLLVGVAVWRLFGMRAAALALATLALTWTEAGGPRLLWLALVVSEALRRVAPPGRLAQGVRLAQLGVGIALLAVAVPFAIREVRIGLFPALERPWERAGAAPGAAGPPERAIEAELASDAAAGAAEGNAPATESLSARALDKRAMLQDVPRSLPASASDVARSNFAPDPSARVPTGPGRPDWTWQQVTLRWSGPVTHAQELGLWLVPPWANALLSLVRVALLAALAAVFARAWRAHERAGRGAPSGGGAAATLAGALALATLAAPAPARADFPPPELLDQLRARLLEAPACAASCATLSRLALSVGAERLELRLALDAAAETGVPLPGGGRGEGAWSPAAVLLDGSAASAVRRADDGTLWLRVAPGRHEVQLLGALPARSTVELALPLAPKRVALATPPAGWVVVGIQPDGSAHGALQLVREQRASAASPGAGASLEPAAVPPFVEITRALELGLSWSTSTVATRIAPESGAIVVAVPLLRGESVTTPGVRVENGRALLTIGAGESAARYDATLAIADELSLTAADEGRWSERWRVSAGPLWHVEASGLPPVDELMEGQRAREWRPWPGEKLTLAIERPAGSDGATLTLDRSVLALAPGLRATDATLTLALRSSQGGQHAVTLPEGARLTSLLVDGEPQPLRQEGARVPLALAPGAREVQLGWREARGITAWFRGSAVDLGAPSVNAHVELTVPEKRWVLFAGGPRLGPSVMFWSALAIVGGLAWVFGRSTLTPLGRAQWLLLGIGLTQAPLAASAPVVACLFALGVRGRAAERCARLRPWLFTALQLALALLALAAAGALVFAIQHGLLGTPEMRIAGNGSDALALRWYLDRAGQPLPQPWVISLSIWWYRAAMLAWSMWLALALVDWARWAFAQWSARGLLRPAPESA